MRLVSVATAALLLLVIAGWEMIFPAPYDPRNPRYLLWKAGLWRISYEQATDTLMLDVKRERLIIGKTRAQLDESYPLLEVDHLRSQVHRSVRHRRRAEVHCPPAGARPQLRHAQAMDGVG